MIGRRLIAVLDAVRSVDRYLLAILGLSLLLNSWHLTWGLPNGNQSWAADAIGPVTALGVARRTFGGWNSGWFYFKYPPAWPLIMVLSFLPYLGLLYMTGGWTRPSSQYPYGFADPERTLFVLTMTGRGVAVCGGVALVALAYGIALRLFDRATARWSAFLTATSYPLVYYSHTTNLDISYCAWLILALYAAVVASRSTRPLPWAALGAAAALALATKEQGFAFLLPLPFLLWAARARATGWASLLGRPTWVMLATGLAILLLANNAVMNPMGFVGRIAYLLGQPLAGVSARLAPVEFSLWKGAKEWLYLGQLWDGLESSFGTVLLMLVGLGAVAVCRRPGAAAWLLLPVAALYYLSLRGLELIALRYLLPVLVIGCILAAVPLAALWRAARRPLARAAGASLLLAVGALSLARAVELDWLLQSDARYQAEVWMAAALPPGTRAEVYQKPAFVPRLRPPVVGAHVPLAERNLLGLAARRPDVIVTSSASHKSITHRWAADWRETRDMLEAEPAAEVFLASLQAGRLPYRVAATFQQNPRVLRNRITSLAPEIRIYVRND